MKAKFKLISVGIKVLATILTLIILVLAIVLLVNANEVPIIACVFALILECSFLYCTFILYRNGIIVDVDKKKLLFKNFRKVTLEIKEIEKIYVDTSTSIDKDRYCRIIVKKSSGDLIKLSGCSTIANSKSVKRTKMLIDEINKILENI